MYLHDLELKRVAEKALDSFDQNQLGPVSYDLQIQYIIKPDEDKRKYDDYSLNPGETVFIASREILSVPDDCMCFISIRNSCIRMGLDINAPIYHPGHHTRLFIRVTNTSSNIIELKKMDSVCNLMFYQLDKATETPYSGKFRDQFDYDDVSEFRSTKLPELIKAEKAVKDVEGMERNIYTNVVTIMTVFIGIFSLMNLNINLLGTAISEKYLILFNLVLLAGISLLTTLVALVVGKGKTKSALITGVITAILFLAALIAYIK